MINRICGQAAVHGPPFEKHWSVGLGLAGRHKLACKFWEMNMLHFTIAGILYTYMWFWWCRDRDNDSGEVRVYPGKLQVSEAYCTVPVNGETTIADLIRESLIHFGLENFECEEYRLSEILLDRGGTFQYETRICYIFQPVSVIPWYIVLYRQPVVIQLVMKCPVSLKPRSSSPYLQKSIMWSCSNLLESGLNFQNPFFQNRS